jgi:hypothetical protein
VLQLRIATGERFGSPTHTATTGKPFVARADEKLTAFIELESTIRRLTMGRKSVGHRLID